MPIKLGRIDPLSFLSAAFILTLAISLWAFGWSVNWKEILPFFLILTALFFASLKVRNILLANPASPEMMLKLATCLAMLFLSMILAAVGAMSCSVLASAAFPYVDKHLHAADQFLGFDWENLLRILLNYPVALKLLSLAYGSIGPQHISIICFLSLLRPSPFIVRFVFAWALTLFITMLAFPFFPAVAAFDFYGIAPAQIPVPTASAGWNLTGLLDSIRSGSDHILNLDKLTGPVTMPSLHAAAAILFAYACWTFRFVRWPAVALNSAMWFSSITIGAHYLVDLIAGSAIAIISIKLANLAYPAKEQPHTG